MMVGLKNAGQVMFYATIAYFSCLLIVDGIVHKAGGETLSEWIEKMSDKYRTIPAFLGFAFGMVFAHFFWPIQHNLKISNNLN